ncbi:UNVERIFIED_CONTAM: DUF433 domain-containing protein [Methylobacteriaceae bacterium AG10]|nr:DUF433 domain-containing protein [Methylobacteriaceae bacterium AG10]
MAQLTPTTPLRAEGFPRISVKPEIMGGKPCIRGLRVTVGMILGELGGGTTIEGLLAGYPYLAREDVLEALRFGASLASVRDVAPGAVE